MNTITYTNWDSSNRYERIEKTIEDTPKMIAAMEKLQSLGKRISELKIKVIKIFKCIFEIYVICVKIRRL